MGRVERCGWMGDWVGGIAMRNEAPPPSSPAGIGPHAEKQHHRASAFYATALGRLRHSNAPQRLGFAGASPDTPGRTACPRDLHFSRARQGGQLGTESCCPSPTRSSEPGHPRRRAGAAIAHHGVPVRDDGVFGDQIWGQRTRSGTIVDGDERLQIGARA